jgi:hypothetical protein
MTMPFEPFDLPFSPGREFVVEQQVNICSVHSLLELPGENPSCLLTGSNCIYDRYAIGGGG